MLRAPVGSDHVYAAIGFVDMYYTEGGEIGSRLQRNRDNLVVLCSAEELPCGLDLERERCVLACCEGCLEIADCRLLTAYFFERRSFRWVRAHASN